MRVPMTTHQGRKSRRLCGKNLILVPLATTLPIITPSRGFVRPRTCCSKRSSARSASPRRGPRTARSSSDARRRDRPEMAARTTNKAPWSHESLDPRLWMCESRRMRLCWPGSKSGALWDRFLPEGSQLLCNMPSFCSFFSALVRAPCLALLRPIWQRPHLQPLSRRDSFVLTNTGPSSCKNPS